jgi:DNA-binding HxlR family transcriptional regulator
MRSPWNIPTNILADRLKRLESAGIVASTPYQKRPVRYAYALTPKGSALGEVLLAFVRWEKSKSEYEHCWGAQACLRDEHGQRRTVRL